MQHNVEKLTEAIGALGTYTGGERRARARSADQSRRARSREHYDSVNGGLGSAPKFPNTFVFSLFLRGYDADDDSELRRRWCATR